MKYSSGLVLFCVCVTLQFNLIQGEIDSTNDEAVRQYLAKFAENGTDLEKWEAPEEMKKSLVYYLSGFDEDNRPIWVAEWGKWDAKKYVDAGGKDFEDYDKYFSQQIVRMVRSIKMRSTEDNPVSEMIFIVDMEGYPLEQLTSTGSLVYQIQKFAGFSPVARTIEKGFIINANFVAERIIGLIKPVLGDTFNRFETYGTNKEKWIPRLLKQIPKSQLPEWYGGTKDFKPVKVYGRK